MPCRAGQAMVERTVPWVIGEVGMQRRYLAFDLAMAEAAPDGEWRDGHRHSGIACAAMLPSDTGQLVTWYGRMPNGGASSRMSENEAKIMVRTLEDAVREGYILVTWNGLSFDLPALAEESRLETECRLLSSRHVDMMFHVYCIKGQYLGLDAAALGMRLSGRSPGTVGKDAPRFWAQGKHQQVLDYLAEELRITVDVASTCERRKVLLWTNRRGAVLGMDLPNGWHTVQEAAMGKGIDFTQWKWDR